jgi:hypothetical protein
LEHLAVGAKRIDADEAAHAVGVRCQQVQREVAWMQSKRSASSAAHGPM